jgi:hypothetical protein
MEGRPPRQLDPSPPAGVLEHVPQAAAVMKSEQPAGAVQAARVVGERRDQGGR